MVMKFVDCPASFILGLSEIIIAMDEYVGPEVREFILNSFDVDDGAISA